MEECEDAVGINLAAGRFAVADGATEAFDARRWAETLAHNWVEGQTAPLTVADFRSWVETQGGLLQAAWRGRSLPWYVEEKARRGSFAAFVGLQFEAGESGSLWWRSLALGDSCLIHCRAQKLQTAFPLSDANQFNSAPQLVPSIWPAQAENLSTQIALRDGAATIGDVFYLFSDALAAWYLRLVAEGDNKTLRLFKSWLVSAERDNLVGMLLAEKRAGRLRDDDCAVIRVAVESV